MTTRQDMGRGVAIAFGFDERADKAQWGRVFIVGYLGSLLADLTSDDPVTRDAAKRTVLEYERRGVAIQRELGHEN